MEEIRLRKEELRRAEEKTPKPSKRRGKEEAENS
jgi:hypothetical protein